jgi:2-methylcitrate dehydratase PrpD
VWPTVLALGQWRKIDGKAAIAAYVAGFETGARVARAAGPGHYQSAWHVTGTAGHLAAVAAAANVLGLSPAAATHALGTAATQASGLREIYGSDTKAIHPGKAAMDGVLSALLAQVGFTSTDTAIEGPRGLLQAVAPTGTPELLIEGLQSHWHLLENGHKLYPTASLTHAAIEAMIGADRPAPDDVATIEVRMHPFAAAVTALVQPKTGAEARFSTAHCVAVALLHGSLYPADFNDEVVGDPAVATMRERVVIVSDENIDKRGCRITIRTRNGDAIVSNVERNRGTPAAPLQDAELADKLAYSARIALGEQAVPALIERCWTVEAVADVNDLVGLMVPS